MNSKFVTHIELCSSKQCKSVTFKYIATQCLLPLARVSNLRHHPLKNGWRNTVFRDTRREQVTECFNGLGCWIHSKYCWIELKKLTCFQTSVALIPEIFFQIKLMCLELWISIQYSNSKSASWAFITLKWNFKIFTHDNFLKLSKLIFILHNRF